MVHTCKSSVIVYKPDYWYSTFLVDDVNIVETIDIYTYKCMCDNNLRCTHADSVKDYVLDRMDLFADGLKISRVMVPQMKEELDKLSKHVAMHMGI